MTTFTYLVKTYAGPYQTLMMEIFCENNQRLKTVNFFWPLAIIAKLSILDVCGGPGHAFSTHLRMLKMLY